MSNPQFVDPFEDQDCPSKMSTWLPEELGMFFKGVRPVKGTVQTMINLLLKGVYDECRALGIADYNDRDRLESVVLRRSAVGFPSNNEGTGPHGPNERGRTKSLHNKNKKRQDSGSNLQGGGSKGGPGKEVGGSEGA